MGQAKPPWEHGAGTRQAGSACRQRRRRTWSICGRCSELPVCASALFAGSAVWQ